MNSHVWTKSKSVTVPMQNALALFVMFFAAVVLFIFRYFWCFSQLWFSWQCKGSTARSERKIFTVNKNVYRQIFTFVLWCTPRETSLNFLLYAFLVFCVRYFLIPSHKARWYFYFISFHEIPALFNRWSLSSSNDRHGRAEHGKLLLIGYNSFRTKNKLSSIARGSGEIL